MNRTFLKNILRDLKDTLGKVISIMIMVALATMIVVGLVLSGPSMRKSLNKSLFAYDEADIFVKSTYPMDYEDKAILSKDPDIDKISYGKLVDLEDNKRLIRLESFDHDFKMIKLEEGKIPEKNDEIILDYTMKKAYKIGDKIDFTYLTNDQKEANPMKNLSYKVVGFYLSSEKFLENMKFISPVGKREIDGFAIVNGDNFLKDEFDEVFISYKQTYMDKTLSLIHI